MMQNTPEWRAARLGKMTASKAAVIMGRLDTSGLDSYIKDLAWERVYGERDADFSNAAMERGHEFEQEAMEWYRFETDSDADLVGLIDHPAVAMVAASPDALRADRTVEVKCPLHKAWMDVLRTGLVPSEYRWQCRWAQWCCGVRLTDFVAYHPTAGGLILQLSATDEECEQMAERAALVETKIRGWVEILHNERK